MGEAEATKEETLEIKNAQVIFPNFEGRRTKFTPEGNRYFSIVLTKRTEKQVKERGWAVKTTADGVSYITIHLATEHFVPNTHNLQRVDVVIRPYHWQVHDKTGIKLYLEDISPHLKGY